MAEKKEKHKEEKWKRRCAFEERKVFLEEQKRKDERTAGEGRFMMMNPEGMDAMGIFPSGVGFGGGFSFGNGGGGFGMGGGGGASASQVSGGDGGRAQSPVQVDGGHRLASWCRQRWRTRRGSRRWRSSFGVVVASMAEDLPSPVLRLRRARREEVPSSEKTVGGAGGDADGFPWSNAMLQWQRTGFHFQPEKNWMNGPVYYRGWYHLFYQYNPEGAVWGNIAWGHAVSRDLIHWRHLPLAMVPDQWYDINGVWTGSATVLPDGSLVMLYTGSTNTSVQVQCLAVPADPNDSLLRNWTKYEANPILVPPPGIGDKDFRDPTTAWFDESDKTWRTVIGSKDNHGHTGIVMTYKTKDFINYELIPGLLHSVPGTGMWECIDFYPVGGADGSEELYAMKESSDDDRHDWYALGRYDAAANKYTPIDAEMDVGIGLRYDWGKFYASKTFYDPSKNRRVLWGWIGETDSERADVAKGWASLQSIPRTVELDEKTRTNLIQWPVVEIETLRINSTDLGGTTIDTGTQDVVKRVVGFTVPVLDGEDLSLRVLVDHSIVESFAMGGRSTATSRVYPTEAIYAAAGVYLFNNATGAAVTMEKLVVHEMDDSYNQIFTADDASAAL
ncbi:Acid beta-fructofuranosidase [Triticum urartu]|uniref:Acid beta-fructofuranosidase n=1 Tax=Triticum urartu TaxID=4572 RepID=M7ZP03_TRIUA|nr:Acid beta-fructofuranosidase [Triticum urartu]